METLDFKPAPTFLEEKAIVSKPAKIGNPIKVAIADDHGLLRQGLISLLQKMDGIDMIGEVSSGEEAVNFAREHTPDVFLIDIDRKSVV